MVMYQKHRWERLVPFTQLPNGRLIVTDQQVAQLPWLSAVVQLWSNLFIYDASNGWYVYNSTQPF